MPANTTPIFPLTPRFAAQAIKIANLAKDGTTPVGLPGTTPTFTTIMTAGLDGTRIDQIKARSLGPNSTGVLRLFINNGVTNRLVHESTLTGVSATSTRTVTNQTSTGNTFTTSAAHGYSVGDMVYLSVLSTITSVTLNKLYYVTSIPTTTTFTLMDENGTAVTVGTNITGASATIISMGGYDGTAYTDFDITIPKNSTETAPPIPYLPAGHSLVATVGVIGTASAGWMISVFGADY